MLGDVSHIKLKVTCVIYDNIQKHQYFNIVKNNTNAYAFNMR